MAMDVDHFAIQGSPEALCEITSWLEQTRDLGMGNDDLYEGMMQGIEAEWVEDAGEPTVTVSFNPQRATDVACKLHWLRKQQCGGWVN